jgi:hypothetical protein
MIAGAELRDRENVRHEDHFVHLDGVTWADCERLLEIRGDHSAPRITYLAGTLEILLGCSTPRGPCPTSRSSSSRRPRGCSKPRSSVAIDGRRSSAEIAQLVAKRYGLQRSEAEGAVRRVLREVYEATVAAKIDATAALE